MASDTTMQEDKEAEANAAAGKKAPRVARTRMRLKYRLLLILTSLLLMGMLRTGFIFVLVAMLPAIVAYYTDVTAERYTFKTIFACNLAGLLPSLGTMLKAGPSSALLQSTISNPGNWMVIYGAAMIGWLLVEVCPMIAHVVIAGLHQTQVGSIERMQKKIEGEWGPEVTQLSREGDEEDEE
jgi:hypothetical protein